MNDITLMQLTLSRAPEDFDYFGPQFQSELRRFAHRLEAEGINVSYGHAMFDSATAVGGIVGEFLVPLSQVFGPIIGVALGAWIQGRFGRKVRMKLGEIELEASSEEELEMLVRKVLEMKKTMQDNNGV